MGRADIGDELCLQPEDAHLYAEDIHLYAKDVYRQSQDKPESIARGLFPYGGEYFCKGFIRFFPIGRSG